MNTSGQTAFVLLCLQFLTTNVVGSNPTYVRLYSIQHYVLKVVSDLRQVCGLRVRLHQ
jgi:hypothetical protein